MTSHVLFALINIVTLVGALQSDQAELRPVERNTADEAQRIIDYYQQYSKDAVEVHVAYDWKEVAPFITDPFSPPKQAPSGLSHASFRVSVALGRDRLAYSGFNRTMLSSKNPKPLLEPYQSVISGTQTYELFYLNGVPKQYLQSCADAQLPGVGEYLIYAELFNCILTDVSRSHQSLAETLRKSTPVGWVENGGIEEFVFRQELPSVGGSKVREWAFRAEGVPDLTTRVTRSTSASGANQVEHVDEFKYTWGERENRRVPVNIRRKTRYNQEGTNVEQSLSLVSIQIAPRLNDSLFKLEAPSGVEIIDNCNPVNRAPTARFGAFAMLSLLMFGVVLLAALFYRARYARNSGHTN